MGSTGPDVMKLQQFLNADADTRVAASGVGSVGAETDYFGGLTAAAVSKMQVKYRSDILSPAGLVNPTGYFGPSSRAKANMLCASAPVVVDDHMDDHDDDDMDDDDSDNGSLSGGEADVNSYEASDEDDEAEEGMEDVPVLNIEFDVEDGDVRLERMDINFNNANISGSAEDEPWDVFEEISIWVDGDKVASEDATDEDDWDESGNDFEFRLTNIDEIFREDTTGEVIVAVSIANGVDVDNTPGNNEWDVNIPANGMRFMDSVGLDITGPSGAPGTDASTFEVQEAGANDDLDLESSDEDPDASTLEISEDDKVEHLIFAFDLSADDSDGDVVLDNFVSINVYVNSANGSYDILNEFVDDFRIEIDGESFDAESYTGTGASAVVDFDIDGDVVIPEDETVTALVYATFDDVDNDFTQSTIAASTTAAQIDAEGDSSGENISVDGSTKTGETHTLRLNGLTLSAEPTDGTDSTDSEQVVSGVATADNYGVMFLEFEITAFGDDLWIPAPEFSATTTFRGAAGATSSIAYEILKSGSANASSGIAIDIDYDIEGADEDNGFFELEEGETYTMVVTIESLNPQETGLYSFRLNSVGYSTNEDSAPDTQAAPDDPSEYISDAVSIQN
jgi:hypothetical protein